VLGNSHVASLRSGWDQISDAYPQHSYTFFAARGFLISKLELEDNMLIPKSLELFNSFTYTSGGQGKIDLNEYDLFLIYGLDFNVPILDARDSSGLLKALFSDIYQASLTFDLAKKIRGVVSVPIYIGHIPLEACNPNFTVGFPENCLSYENCIEKMQSAIEIPNVTLSKQPLVTRYGEYNSKQEYSKGSRRLDIGDRISNQLHPVDDFMHMNGQFGALWMEDFLANLAYESKSQHAKLNISWLSRVLKMLGFS